MSAFTGLMVIAGLGLLKNGSLGVSRTLTSVVDNFTNLNISGIVQSRLSTASAEVIESLRYAPSFMTGLPPLGVQGYTDDQGQPTVTNIPKAILDQGKSLFTPVPTLNSFRLRFNNGGDDVGVFASVYSKSSAYTAQAFTFAGSLAQSSGQKFDDLGFQFGNYTDVCTGGISNQFNTAGVPALAKEMPNLGTMFSTADLSRMFHPGSMVQNLLYQGLGDLGNLENKVLDAGIDLNNLNDTDADRLFEILSSVRGSDLDQIIEITQFRPAHLENIHSLADVLNINNLFSDEAISAVGNGASLDDLSNKLSNVGGTFKDTASIGQLYGSVNLTNFPTLNSLGAVLPDSVSGGQSSLGGLLGVGSGIFGQPTMNDMTGSASGVGYVDDIQAMIDAQKDIESNSAVILFKDYLETTAELDPTVLNTLIYDINVHPCLIELIAANNQRMINCAERLFNEKNNLSLAGITPGTTAAGADGLMTLTGQLPGLGVDPMNLGLGDQLSNMATDDVYGEAVQASLIEGQNRGRLAVFGIDSGTKMDPMEYANSLRGMA